MIFKVIDYLSWNVFGRLCHSCHLKDKMSIFLLKYSLKTSWDLTHVLTGLYASPGTAHAIPTLVLSSCSSGHYVTAKSTWERNPIWLHLPQSYGYIRHLRTEEQTRADLWAFTLWPESQQGGGVRQKIRKKNTCFFSNQLKCSVIWLIVPCEHLFLFNHPTVVFVKVKWTAKGV